jgi:hypothetical protein
MSRPLRRPPKVSVGSALLHRRKRVMQEWTFAAFAAIACFLDVGQSQFFTQRIKLLVR